MPVQVFVDESGTQGGSGHFAVAGLIGHSADWVSFAEEWEFILRAPPAIGRFKMKEAAALNGQFHGFTEAERNQKLRRLAQTVNRYAKVMTYSVIDIRAHSLTWAKLPKPMRELYFWPFHTTILASCFTLWDFGWRERFEIIFDEQVIFGPRARHWYPVVRELCKLRESDPAEILPADPIFRSDDDCLPLQAADMFAWCLRHNTNNPSAALYDWLLDEMPNVKGTDYSQYYDLERMKNVLQQMVGFLKDGSIPQELLDMCKNFPGQKDGSR